jgi:mRNA interferase HigB
MKAARFSNIQGVRAVFPHADKVGKFTVFNIGGNKARLVAAIQLQSAQGLTYAIF